MLLSCRTVLAAAAAIFLSASLASAQESWKVYNDAGLGAYELGRLTEAEQLLRRAVRETDSFVAADPRRATALNNLASVYRLEGKYDQAETSYQQALDILDRAFGSKHLAVATALNNLADLYRVRRRLDDAEPLYLRALEIKRYFLTDSHPSLATTLNNLGLLYHARGDYNRAEPLYWRAYTIRKNALGEKHPETIQSLSNLAVVHHDRGDLAEAERLYQDVLALRQEVLPRDSPVLAATLNEYAALLRQLDRAEEAIPLEARARTILEHRPGTK